MTAERVLIMTFTSLRYDKDSQPKKPKTSASNASDSEEEFSDAMRPITMDDLRTSLIKLKESKIQCGSLVPNMRIELD
ncbi:unnamed protein product [Leptidea sinapis]|uniref:Uncharacterized protein n=1 Tax=Leptidea sinapis TaxID=189913 RepID=A0A5E4PMJ8_9NEOP|nr:unnamed protein product [Leptidea sinapis]